MPPLDVKRAEEKIGRRRTPPVPPSQRTSRVIPEALEAPILRCLAKDPEDRPP